MRSRAGSVFVSLALVALAGGCGSSASERAGQQSKGATHVLTMLKPIDNGEELAYFASEVARLSKGRLRIRVVPSGHSKQPDFEASTIRDVQQGRGDLAFAGARAWDEFGVHRMS